MVREFAECPMTRMADGQKILNLQYVEGALCEFRKFVTEQPKLAVLFGKMRPRSGLKYVPKCAGGGDSGAADDYANWLDVVQYCVVKSWNAPDRTDRKIWAADIAFPADEDTTLHASRENACRLHPKMSARAAAELGVIFDVLDSVVTQVALLHTRSLSDASVGY